MNASILPRAQVEVKLPALRLAHRDPYVTTTVEHHVGRLQIAMQHIMVMRGSQASAELVCDRDTIAGRQAANTPQETPQVLTVDVLHRKEMFAAGFSDCYTRGKRWDA